jgi:hypothetical protein
MVPAGCFRFRYIDNTSSRRKSARQIEPRSRNDGRERRGDAPSRRWRPDLIGDDGSSGCSPASLAMVRKKLVPSPHRPRMYAARWRRGLRPRQRACWRRRSTANRLITLTPGTLARTVEYIVGRQVDEGYAPRRRPLGDPCRCLAVYPECEIRLVLGAVDGR